MGAPDGEASPPKRFNPPAWMIERARANSGDRLIATSSSPNTTPKKPTTEERSGAVRNVQGSGETVLVSRPKHSLPKVGTGVNTGKQSVNDKSPSWDTQFEPRKIRQAPGDKGGQEQKRSKDNISGAVATSVASSPKAGVADTQLNIAHGTLASTDPLAQVNATSALLPVPQTKIYLANTLLPKWYIDIKVTSFPMVQLGKKRPQALSALDGLKDCIRRCEGTSEPCKLHGLFEELRNHVHKAEIVLEVNKYIVKKARILTLENGLPRIFNRHSKYPPDLKADSFQLYSRWLREDFSQDILRGIVTVKAKDRNGDRLDQSFREKHPTTAKFYGEGSFVLGQWWPTQLCTVRDGAHGATQGGISGEKEKGAYSIVLSSGGYDDNDEGDIIEYSGTEGKDFKATEATQHMLLSAELGNDIRVIRSCQLSIKNPYRPLFGFRYDGLYKITSFKLVDEEKQNYLFRLERRSGQEPIRCQDNAARRPTDYEIAQYKRMKQKVW